jgi:phage baseplate assembly protein W
MSSDFIGRGWAFPVRADKTGRIALVARERELAESIELILRTSRGDRPMRPEFGCGIWDEVFSPMDATTAGRVAYSVRAALDRWEPRINVTAVDVTYGDNQEKTGLMEVRITYVERETNDRRNLVFPFYVIPEEREG